MGSCGTSTRARITSLTPGIVPQPVDLIRSSTCRPRCAFVGEGKLLAAQHRLGHRDLSTTLRHYGWAQPPDDVDIANHLDMVLSTKIDSPTGE